MWPSGSYMYVVIIVPVTRLWKHTGNTCISVNVLIDIVSIERTGACAVK